MNILDEIIAHKRVEVEQRRKEKSINELVKMNGFDRSSRSLVSTLKSGTGIMAEFKRKSPSAGSFHSNISLEETLNFYEQQQVSGLSILTDQTYFGGELVDLEVAAGKKIAPVLRKDFIVDEYQIFEAKAYGADAILLIAAALDEYHAKSLAVVAQSLGLEVLMEFHSAEELSLLNENVDIVGINNRNLKTLKTDVRTALELARQLPFDRVKIAESGISSAFEIQELLKVGFDGFLIGESVLKNPGLLAAFNTAITHFKRVNYAS